VHVIGEAAEYLDAIDQRARELSALAEGVPMALSTRGHTRVDHIRVIRSGASFQVQVVSHDGVSLPPYALDDDPTLSFTEAWQGDETGGHLVLDAEAVAILTYVVQVEANGATN
jgi:hypothetical protein